MRKKARTFHLCFQKFHTSNYSIPITVNSIFLFLHPKLLLCSIQTWRRMSILSFKRSMSERKQTHFCLFKLNNDFLPNAIFSFDYSQCVVHRFVHQNKIHPQNKSVYISAWYLEISLSMKAFTNIRERNR